MIDKQLLFANENIKTKQQVIEKLAGKAKELDYIFSEADFIHAVLEREKEFPTSVGFGVAIPHGKTDAVKEPFIAFLKAEKPFIWEEESQTEVQLIFMIGVPTHLEGTLHLVILSQISRMLMKEDFREKLLASEDSETIYKLLMEIENRTNEKLKQQSLEESNHE